MRCLLFDYVFRILLATKRVGRAIIEFFVELEIPPWKLLRRFLRNMEANYVGEIDMRSAHDIARCNIMSLAALSNDRIVAVDYGNSKVKLFYSFLNKPVFELMVPDPRQVTTTIKDQVAVTSCSHKKILILKVTETITNEREIILKNRNYCVGIAYSDYKLLVTFANNDRIDILDLYGNVLRRIGNTLQTDERHLGIEYVCVNKDGTEIYVSDRRSDEITVLSFDGQVKRRFKMAYALQVCCDIHGNTYFCGGGYSTITRMNRSGERRAFLTKSDGLKYYCDSICYCQETNKLCVGLPDHTVKVYQLSSS